MSGWLSFKSPVGRYITHIGVPQVNAMVAEKRKSEDQVRDLKLVFALHCTCDDGLWYV